MAPMDCIIFDLDSTLANTEHRSHFLEREERDWDLFFAACFGDEPIIPLIHVLLTYQQMGFPIIIVTGRPEAVRDTTVRWLQEKAGISKWDCMYMRGDGDYRPATEFKKEVLFQLRALHWNPLLAVDDDVKAAQMYFDNGVPCFVVI